LVVDQWRAGQAHDRGRSCKAAQSRRATRTQGWYETYFWWKSLATVRTAWYNGGQSSRTRTFLLGGGYYQGRRAGPRTLLLSTTYDHLCTMLFRAGLTKDTTSQYGTPIFLPLPNHVDIGRTPPYTDLPVSTGSLVPRPEARDNRENGANPLRGRRCDRPGLRTPHPQPLSRRARGEEDKPLPAGDCAAGGKAVRDREADCSTCFTSRKPEDLPAEGCVPMLRPRASGQALSPI
jgi:hypothetical protein